MVTSPAFTYKYLTVVDLANRDTVVFTVRTDYDATLLLTDDSETSDPWEIIIGGWPEHGGMSAIRRGLQTAQQMAWPETPGIVTRAEDRPFWIQWTADSIRVGRVRAWFGLVSADGPCLYALPYLYLCLVQGYSPRDGSVFMAWTEPGGLPAFTTLSVTGWTRPADTFWTLPGMHAMRCAGTCVADGGPLTRVLAARRNTTQGRPTVDSFPTSKVLPGYLAAWLSGEVSMASLRHRPFS
jgi:hypothetical protein